MPWLGRTQADDVNTKQREAAWQKYEPSKVYTDMRKDVARMYQQERLKLPYKEVLVVFNDKNLWANVQRTPKPGSPGEFLLDTDPQKITYDFNSKPDYAWKAFQLENQRGGGISCFFTARALSSRLVRVHARARAPPLQTSDTSETCAGSIVACWVCAACRRQTRWLKWRLASPRSWRRG